MYTLDDIEQARRRIAPHIVETPVTHDAEFNLWLKWENRQLTHSFKPRGALNKILSLSAEELHAGLVAASAGNHGQGVALAAGLLGVPARVVVPESAAQVKVERMRQLGATVECVPGLYGDAEVHALRLAAQSGATYISPYNDPQVIAGAGTLMLEVLAQAPQVTRWLIPLGGGGLIAGMGIAARALRPEIQIIGVQSEASPYLHQQFHNGNMEGVRERPTLTDGLAGAVEPGSVTIDLLPRICDDVLLVTEEEIASAIRYAYRRLGEVIEGSAAVGLAAVMGGKVHTIDRLTGTLITGGNIDPTKHAAIVGVQ
jgi:threonine dehydratase